MKCRNCNSEFIGNFCPNCGQKTNSGRIILKESISDLADHWLGLDNPFFQTVKELMIRPGQMIQNYIDGKRKSYSHPFRFFIAVLAVYLIIRAVVGFNPIEAFSEMMGAREMPNPDTMTTRSSNFFAKHINSFMVIFAFTLAGFAKLFNLRKPVFYIEYLAASFFIIGEYILLSIFVILLTQLDPRFFSLNYLFVVLYLTYAFTQFQKGSMFVRILKSLVISILGWFSYTLIGFFIANIIVRTFGL